MALRARDFDEAYFAAARLSTKHLSLDQQSYNRLLLVRNFTYTLSTSEVFLELGACAPTRSVRDATARLGPGHVRDVLRAERHRFSRCMQSLERTRVSLEKYLKIEGSGYNLDGQVNWTFTKPDLAYFRMFPANFKQQESQLRRRTKVMVAAATALRDDFLHWITWGHGRLGDVDSHMIFYKRAITDIDSLADYEPGQYEAQRAIIDRHLRCVSAGDTSPIVVEAASQQPWSPIIVVLCTALDLNTFLRLPWWFGIPFMISECGFRIALFLYDRGQDIDAFLLCLARLFA